MDGTPSPMKSPTATLVAGAGRGGSDRSRIHVASSSGASTNRPSSPTATRCTSPLPVTSATTKSATAGAGKSASGIRTAARTKGWKIKPTARTHNSAADSAGPPRRPDIWRRDRESALSMDEQFRGVGLQSCRDGWPRCEGSRREKGFEKTSFPRRSDAPPWTSAGICELLEARH